MAFVLCPPVPPKAIKPHDKPKPSTQFRTRNVCATLKNFVTSVYSPVWYEWPTFPLQTRHRGRLGNTSEPLARTYAVQFKVDSFMLQPSKAESATSLDNVRGLTAPAVHYVHAADDNYCFPPRHYMSSWNTASVPGAQGQIDMRLSLNIAPTQLQLLFPAQDTDWNSLLGSTYVDVISTKSKVVTTHTVAPFEYMVVVASGSVKAIWTTDKQYSKMTKDTSSYS